MTGVRKSLLLSLLDSYIGLVLQLTATVIISRLLTPAEVGVFAIAAVFSALASTFRDFGVAEYLIQERDLTTEKIRAALALNIAISWSMAALLAGAAPLLAAFYRDPGVGHVMTVQAINFLLVPFGAVTQAWFRRELNYRPIVICNVLSSIGAFVVAVALALLGFGYMSLAWSSLAGIVVTALAAAWFRPAGFPLWPSFKGVGQVFQFGKFASAVYIVGQIGKGAPELIIGRARGTADVGIYSRAGGLVEMFNRLLMRPVLQVCMPYFARSNRESGGVVPAYLNSVSLLSAVGWPFLGFLAVVSYAAIRIVYGAQWLAAAPLAQILCLACGIELVFTLSREALLAKGEAARANTLQLQIVALQLLGLCAVFVWGLPGACVGLAAAAAGGAALSQWHLQRGIGLAVGDMLSACKPSLLLLLGAVGPVALLSVWLPPDESNYVHWAVWGTAWVAGSWLVGLRLLRHLLWQEVVGLAARFMGARRAAAERRN